MYAVFYPKKGRYNMVQQSNNSNMPVVCQYCGKTLKKGGTHGALCAKNIKAGYNQANRLALKSALAYATAPVGYITVAHLHTVCVANLVPVARMVKAIGGDGVTAQPAHAITAPVYVNGTRYVSGWLATKAGITAMLTNSYTGATVTTAQKAYYAYVLACQKAVLTGATMPKQPVAVV